MSKLIDADRLKEAFCSILEKFKTENPHKEVIMSVINTEPQVLLSCPKCHGKGEYDALVEYEDGEGCRYEKRKCLICQGTGKISIEKYEELQKASRK